MNKAGRMEILDKGVAIIDSCKTMDHIRVATMWTLLAAREERKCGQPGRVDVGSLMCRYVFAKQDWVFNELSRRLIDRAEEIRRARYLRVLSACYVLPEDLNNERI